MAGRYDRNPFEEDDVNPFAVSNRCTCCSWVAIVPRSRRLGRDSSSSLVEVWSRACLYAENQNQSWAWVRV
jgi:hypothetical protein